MRRNSLFLFLSIAGLAVLLDQATKCLVVHEIALHASMPVIEGFFNLTYVRNPGAAFGLLSTSEIRVPVLISASVIAIGVIGATFYNAAPKTNTEIFALSFIFAGAMGNLIDRLRDGEVVDFLDLYWRGHHWPTFNVADIAICMGITLYLIEAYWQQHRYGKGYEAARD